MTMDKSFCVTHTFTTVLLRKQSPSGPDTSSGHPSLSFSIVHYSDLRLQPRHALANQPFLSEGF